MFRATRAVRRSITITIAVAGIGAGLGGCTNGPQPHEDPPRTSTPAPSTSSTPSPTLDPRAQPAIDAYLGFDRTSNAAQRRPLGIGKTYPPEADFTKYSWDPLRTEFVAQMAAAQKFGIAYRGTPPTPRIKTAQVRLNADPYPTVVLTNCDTPASTWEAFDPSTGKVLPPTSGSVPPPYLTTATVILYRGRWGVMSITADTSKTCEG